MKLSFEQFYDSGKYSWRRFDFILSEVNVGAEVDEKYFVIWTPPDSSQAPILVDRPTCVTFARDLRIWSFDQIGYTALPMVDLKSLTVGKILAWSNRRDVPISRPAVSRITPPKLSRSHWLPGTVAEARQRDEQTLRPLATTS